MSSSIGLFSKAKPFVAKGFKNWTALFPKQFIDICKMTQEEVKAYVTGELQKYGYEPEVSDGYVYAKGSDVLLTAHMDTVHKETVKTIYGFRTEKKQHAITSPQGIGGDDRCGIYMILAILEKGYRPTVLFCEDEEIGGIGSEKFVNAKPADELSDMKFMIELDRANADDLVYYSDNNHDFHDWCAEITGYFENWGSFSDISHLCPAYGVSGVNISCGYYNAHTLNEYVVLEEMEASIEATVKLLDAADKVEKFVYENYRATYSYYGGMYSTTYYDGLRTYPEINDDDSVGMSFYYFAGPTKTEEETYITGTSIADCWYQFFFDNGDVCMNDVYDYEIW